MIPNRTMQLLAIGYWFCSLGTMSADQLKVVNLTPVDVYVAAAQVDTSKTFGQALAKTVSINGKKVAEIPAYTIRSGSYSMVTRPDRQSGTDTKLLYSTDEGRLKDALAAGIITTVGSFQIGQIGKKTLLVVAKDTVKFDPTKGLEDSDLKVSTNTQLLSNKTFKEAKASLKGVKATGSAPTKSKYEGFDAGSYTKQVAADAAVLDRAEKALKELKVIVAPYWDAQRNDFNWLKILGADRQSLKLLVPRVSRIRSEFLEREERPNLTEDAQEKYNILEEEIRNRSAAWLSFENLMFVAAIQLNTKLRDKLRPYLNVYTAALDSAKLKQLNEAQLKALVYEVMPSIDALLKINKNEFLSADHEQVQGFVDQASDIKNGLLGAGKKTIPQASVREAEFLYSTLNPVNYSTSSVEVIQSAMVRLDRWSHAIKLMPPFESRIIEDRGKSQNELRNVLLGDGWALASTDIIVKMFVLFMRVYAALPSTSPKKAEEKVISQPDMKEADAILFIDDGNLSTSDLEKLLKRIEAWGNHVHLVPKLPEMFAKYDVREDLDDYLSGQGWNREAIRVILAMSEHYRSVRGALRGAAEDVPTSQIAEWVVEECEKLNKRYEEYMGGLLNVPKIKEVVSRPKGAVSNKVTCDDTRSKLNKVSLAFHPDKWSNSDEAAKKQAEEEFRYAKELSSFVLKHMRCNEGTKAEQASSHKPAFQEVD